MQIFWTIISGTLVFTAGQTIQKFILEPVQRHKEVIGEIDNKLKFHAYVISNNGLEEGVVREARKELRKLSCDLESTYKAIPFKKLLSWIFNLKNENKIADSAARLIRVSNTAGNQNEFSYTRKADQDATEIRKGLDIPKLKSNT